MAKVVEDHRAGLDAQTVDTAHVGERGLADGVDGVVGDQVVVRASLRISPAPANADAGVEEGRDDVV